MAVTIKTPQFGRDTCPQAQFTVDVKSSDGGAIVYSWELKWVTHGYTVTSSQSKAYSAKIDGVTVTSGSFAIGGKTTQVIKSGTYTINRGTSSRTVPISVSFDMTFTWSGTSGDTKTASGSFTIGAKTSYTVSYNANGGSGAPSAQTKWFNTNLTLSSSVPSRTGHNFVRWNTNTSNTGTAYNPGGTYSANAGATLYAIWSAHTYTVQYNANGGSGAPGNQTKTYGSNLTLSSTKPTRTNYNFKGWSTSANGGVVYASGGTYTNNSAVTLYAVWELAYQKPRITNFNAYRCTSNGTASETGTYLKVTYNWATDKTVTSAWIDWTTDPNWSTWDHKQVSVSGTSGTVNEIVGDGEISIETSYYVRGTANDSGGGSGSPTVSIGTTKFPIDVKSGGTGVAFGKVAETENLLDVAWDGKFAGELKAKKVNSYFLGVIHPAHWVHIGHFKLGDQGTYAVLDCYTGNGQNGAAYQNSHAKILLKQGYVVGDLPIGVTTAFTQGYSAAYKVVINHLSKQECDLYMYLPYDYNDLTYVVNGSYNSFTPANTVSTSTPTYDKESTYFNLTSPQGLTPTARNTTDTQIPVLDKDGYVNYTLRKFYTDKAHLDHPNYQDNLVTMDMLAWWNGAYDSSGKSDLIYCNQGPIVGQRAKSIADNSGGSKSYIHLGSLKLCWGKVNITPVANTATSVNVTFPLTFARVPSIFVTPHSGAVGSQVHGAAATNMTETGFDCFLYRTNTTVTSVMWLAIGE